MNLFDFILCLSIFWFLRHLYLDARKPIEPLNPYGFGNGDDETDYEESNPNR
jgi:hypothetical protein